MSKPNWRLSPSIFNPRWYPLTLTTKHINKIIGKYIHKDKQLELIDYGCGDMPYKPLFEAVVKEYRGLDIAENDLADVHIGIDGTIPIENNSVDLVLSTQVLEHVENPAEYLSESFRILKNGGALILSTHGYWIYHPTPADYWRWTSSGLRKIIEKAGFEIDYFKGIVSRPSVGILLLQDSLIFKVPKFLIPVIAFPSQILMLILDKVLSSQNSRDKDAAIFMVVCKAKK
jgi:SAM-dependent methyltransferase